MGNHGSCQSDSSIPVKSIVSAPSNKINTLNNIQASTPTSINNGGLKAGNKSSEKSSRASPDPPAHAPGSEGKTKRRLSSFFGSPKPREGAVLAMAATGTQIMMTTQKITCTNLEKYAKVNPHREFRIHFHTLGLRHFLLGIQFEINFAISTAPRSEILGRSASGGGRWWERNHENYISG